MVAGLLASACGAKGADEAADNDKATQTTAAGSTETTAAGDSASKFGSIASPCGKADSVAKVKADEAGTGTDKLYIGVGNDRDSIRPGLLKELWDGTNAFVKWCNEQGGINGLQLEAVDLDGKVLEVEAAMAKACTDVFAIVGGGWAQDNFIFSGKDGADFHKCKMISFPGFAVSTDFAEGSDQVQPLPNPAYDKPASAMVALAKLYPDEVKKFGVVYGTLPSIIQNKDQIIGVAKQTKGFDQFDEIGYDIINQDWAVIAQQVLDKGLKAVSFVGEPPNMSKFSQALRDQGFGGLITYSRKVFLPLTNLCRDSCSYCTFAHLDTDPRAHTMSPDEVLAFLAALPRFETLRVQGLMTLALFSSDLERVRACFVRLRTLRDRARDTDPDLIGPGELSMGMSGDFEVAIDEGATCVRVGQALFGSRAPQYDEAHYWPSGT